MLKDVDIVIMLSHMYVFYADVFLVQNFFIKLTTLLLVALAFGKRIQISIRRIWILAAVATVLEIIVLSIMSNYAMFILFVHLIEIPAITFFMLSGRWKWMPQAIFYSYLFTIIVNGVLEIIWNGFGEYGSYIEILIISCVCLLLGMIIFLKNRRIHKGVYKVELKNAEKKREVSAFYDSGNCLKDPYTGKGVYIVSEKIIADFHSEDIQKVLIPYQTVGKMTDFLEVVYIDEMIIFGQQDIVKQHKIPIGIAKEELFLNKPYEMILNEEVF